MALERVGLAGLLRFDSNSAVNAMRRPRDELGKFIAQGSRASASSGRLAASITRLEASFRRAGATVGNAANRLGGAASTLGGASRALGAAGLPMTVAIGAGTAAAANFEQKMSGVAAITGATDEEMQKLTNKAKEMGATTVFSASQSAEGFELLGRAGFSVSESIDALGGVMNAAAADGIPLGTASGIVANTIRAMGLEAKDATYVADVLALTSAKTNTDVIGLGEGMKFAAAQASTMGIELPTVAAALGVLADSGLKGTLAGTSFTNMLVKLSRPSKKATQLMKEMGASIFETAEGNLDLKKTLASLGPGLNAIHSKTKRAAAITEIFGIRGQKAVNAIDKAISRGKFEELVNQLENAHGSAERMAKIRLDNFKGQVTLLASALEGLAIEVFTPFLTSAKDGLKGITKGIGNVVGALIEFNSETTKTRAELEAKFGVSAVAVAMGVKAAIHDIIQAWESLREKVSNFLKKFTGSDSADFVRKVAYWGTVFAIVAGAVAPIAIAFGGLLALVAALAPVFGAIATAAGAAFTPILVVVGAAGAALMLLGEEGESIGDTLMRVFGLVQGAVDSLIENQIMPWAMAFTDVVRPAVLFLWETIKDFVNEARDEFQKFFSGLIQAGERLAPFFRGVFSILGSIVGTFVAIATDLFSSLLIVIKAIFKPIRAIAVFIIESIVNTLVGFVKAAVTLAEKVGIELPPGFKEFAEGGEFTVKEVSVDEAAGISTASAEAAKAAAEASAESAEQKGAGAKKQNLEAKVNIEDKRCVEVSNKVTMDGREQNLAASRHRQEVNERAGFKATPWQRRMHLEQGSAPPGGN